MRYESYLKMVAACPCETLVTTYERILYHNQQDHNPNGEGRPTPDIFMIQVTSQKRKLHV
jgi:hypothetical protein